MAKKIQCDEFGPHSEVEVATSVNIPVSMKKICKERGIGYKQCFLIGFDQVVNGGIEKRKEINEEIINLIEGNKKLHRKLTELSLKIRDLEKIISIKGEQKCE